MESGYAALLFQLRKKELKIKNKYENMDIIELENPEDIVDSLISCAMDAYEHCKTTALIANKELVVYAMGEVLVYDDFNVRKVDMELDDIEYMISIDKDGDVVVQPVMEYHDKFFEGIDIAFISMDGDVSQDIIDWLIDRDKDVTLFGLKDEPCECKCKECGKDFEKKLYDALDSFGSRSAISLLFGARHRQILNAIEEMDEMNEWLKLLSK